MRMTSAMTVAFLSVALVLGQAAGASEAEGWIPLFDGKTLSGWRVAEHPDSITVRDGMIVFDGPRAHMFYAGDVRNADFKNFELEAVVKVEPGANSGVFFHTEFQQSGYPRKGYEAQINNTYEGHGNFHEFKKTGSLYGVRNQFMSIVNDDEWFTLGVAVTGKRIRIRVNDTLVADYTEPADPVRNERRAERLLSHGTFALQCHDERSKAFYKSIRVKPLPEDAAEGPLEQSVVDGPYAQIVDLNLTNFPIIDFHVHLKGGLTVDEALANSRRVGINYGIAPNCGLGFPITDDAGITKFLEGIEDRPLFVGMQAEGREWVNLFSTEAIGRFDYVFSDAMTFTDDAGKRIRLWIAEEVQIDDEQAFMEMYVKRILSVLNDEPIDIYVNPTFLPACIAEAYDTLWTEARMDRVIAAAVDNDVAIEINARYRIPSPRFIKRAKEAGVTFALGTNNTGRELGRLEYCLEMIGECGLTSDDMFMP